eukprot:TRINITY_DN6168_c0_g1_i1.p1 TRINITY_DN6168_c0_g1~~TRINITY_DN6168_c0_g1_i1.p1  ORF type:complete len:324 (-),score=98.15 TRINITY_DN6168_c0_g1_i1:83-1054(-)
MFLYSVLLLVSACLAQETALVTGGFNGYESARDGCELLNSGCAVPSFPVVSNMTGGTNRAGRSDHVTHVTEDGVILSCGGESADGTDDFSCLSLDVATGSWVLHSILNFPRLKASSVALPGIGLMILGGFKQLSSELLPVGATEWEMGPTLPGTLEDNVYYGFCSIVLSPTEFMVIGGESGPIAGNLVQVYSAETGEWDRWEDLPVSRWGHACTRVGDLVIVAGGVTPSFTMMASTTVLDLNTRESREVGEMTSARAWFGMATIDGRVLAFGGMSPLKDSYENIMELDMETEEWVEQEETLGTGYGISSFASVVIQQNMICTP